MSQDSTEAFRRAELPRVNALTRDAQNQPRSADDVRADLEAQQGQVWDYVQLRQDFDVQGFAAPYVLVVRKRDRQRGTLRFTHSPRLYYGFQPA
jgi:hypothetical protein